MTFLSFLVNEMNHIEMKRAVVNGHYFEDEESLAAYAYDASSLEGLPLGVVRPSQEEEVRRVLQAANQNRIPLITRGAGTNVRGAVVKTGAVIIDMRRFDAIERLDVGKGIVTVGAGITIKQLNEFLARHNLYFPLVPENPLATLGGLASQNHLTEESQLFGDYHSLVLQLECFDGLGRHHTLKEQTINQVVGQEGTTGIIIKVHLKVFPKNHKITLNIQKVKDVTEAAAKTPPLRDEKGVLMIEYLDAASSEQVGLEKDNHLLIAYANDRGSYKDSVKIEEILRRRKELEPAFWEQGFTLMEEATLSLEKVGAFEALCRKEGVPCYGHLGQGILLTCLKDTTQRDRFLAGVVSFGGIPAGKHGYGRTKREYVPADTHKATIHLKEERDYNNILNPGVLV